MTRLCANVVVIGIGIFLLGSSTAEAQPQLPTEQDVQGALAACSIPRSREVEANLIGAINLWKNEKLSGRANIRFTSFLDSFSDENVKLKAYEIYIGCLKVFLDKFSEGGGANNKKVQAANLLLRDLSIPVIYSHETASSWDAQWTTTSKVTVSRQMKFGSDPCRIEVEQITVSQRTYDTPTTGVQARTAGGEVFQMIDSEKDKALRLQNTTRIKEQYAINTGEINGLSVDNFSKGAEYFVMWGGMVPNRYRNLSSNDDIYSLTAKLPEKRIAKVQDETEVELLDSVFFLGPSKSAVTRMADALQMLVNACGAGAGTVEVVQNPEPKRPEKVGEGTNTVLDIIFGGPTLTIETPPKQKQHKVAPQGAKRKAP